jgi:hypothetical protein
LPRLELWFIIISLILGAIAKSPTLLIIWASGEILQSYKIYSVIALIYLERRFKIKINAVKIFPQESLEGT